MRSARAEPRSGEAHSPKAAASSSASGVLRADQERLQVVQVEHQPRHVLEQHVEEEREPLRRVVAGEAVHLLDDLLPLEAEPLSAVLQELADQGLGAVRPLLGLLAPEGERAPPSSPRRSMGSTWKASVLLPRPPSPWKTKTRSPSRIFRRTRCSSAAAADEAGGQHAPVADSVKVRRRAVLVRAHSRRGGEAQRVVRPAVVEDELRPGEGMGVAHCPGVLGDRIGAARTARLQIAVCGGQSSAQKGDASASRAWRTA